MSRQMQALGVSTIASSDSVGNGIVLGPIGVGGSSVAIQTPDDLLESCWLEASFDDGVTWRRVQVYSVDIALTANRIVIVDFVACRQLRAASDTPVSGDRTFSFWNILDI